MKNVIYFIRRLNSFGGIILSINLLGMVLLSLFEGIGILLLVSMISISGILNINGGGGAAFTPYIKALQAIPGMMSFSAILLFYVLLIISQNLLQRNLMIRNVRIQTEFIRQLRVETYEAILQANWRFFVKKRKSDLINLLTLEIARVHSGTNLCLDFLSSLIFTLVQICFAFLLSPQITIFVLLCGLFLSFFSKKFIRKARKLGNQTSELAQSYLAGITDQMNGIKDIKSNTLEKSHVAWFRSLTKEMVDEQVQYMVLSSSSQLFYKIASAILMAGFIYLSVKLFQFQPEQFLVIILIFSRLWPRITGIQSNVEKIASLVPSFRALMEWQEECKEALEYKNRPILESNVMPIRIQDRIECKAVNFRYNQDVPTYALQDINVQIPSNQMTAIVGRSGAGKSTLIDILMGLLQPENGLVLLDGKPLNSENISALRRSLSYVPQEPFLFNTSIRGNLLLVEPNASEEQMWEALEFSAAAEFVKKLPQGLETHIGDRGVRLSGGERQRLVLARAILRKPGILILDEATSALDTENEAKIQVALERLKGTMTIIVIAHRLSTIRNADQVIVLDQGVIAQSGRFSELEAEKRGIFSHLLRNQTKVSI